MVDLLAEEPMTPRQDPTFPEPEVRLKSGRMWSRYAIEAWEKATGWAVTS